MQNQKIWTNKAISRLLRIPELPEKRLVRAQAPSKPKMVIAVSGSKSIFGLIALFSRAIEPPYTAI
jgi:hypothetical protein